MNESVKELMADLKVAMKPKLEDSMNEVTNVLFAFAEKKIKASKNKYDDVLLIGLEPLKSLVLSGIKHVFIVKEAIEEATNSGTEPKQISAPAAK